MADLDTHRVIDLIPSRETSDVADWLKEYPNIVLVSRDGSTTYANAISIAHPDAYQVSDKFHLIKNLTERATLYFQKIFKGRITIPVTSQSLIRNEAIRNGTAAEKVSLVKKLHSEGKTKAEIHAITGIGLPTVKKYIDLPGDQISERKKTAREREHEEAIQKVQAKADWVRELHANGLSKYAIAKKTGFTAGTVTRYLSPDFTPVSGHYGKLREGKLASYRNTVLQMRSEGATYEKIYVHIRQLGYNGSVAALREFVTKEKRIAADLREDNGSRAVELIERKWMIQLLYRPLEKVKGIAKEQYEAVIRAYPEAATVYRIIEEFKIAISTKETKYLFGWMDEVRALSIAEFDSFLNGLEQDIEAVRNTVIFDCNNGLAEGCINKLKVIKRIMYGRCSFELLRKKVIGWDQWKRFN
jgi:predicted transcriptional regulator